jgi:hypothetical protein
MCAYCGAAYLAMGGVEGSIDLSEAFATFVPSMGTSGMSYGMAFIDDWNGDGADEVAVSAPYNSPTYDGITAVFSGLDLFP